MKMIDAGLSDRQGRPVTLRGIDDENWRAVADVVPRDDQRDWVATSGARYLLLSEREGVWTSLAVYAGDEVAGHIMYAFDDDDERYWIGGMLVDEPAQRLGIGRASIVTLVSYLLELEDCDAVRLSVHDENTAARKLYGSVGFTELDKDEDGDWTAELTELTS
ncbi:GNAT family N-acetyltransferase [Kineosporia succinea]|uniref:Diamine N-acetyltransferase n=1 Tax=Kineosporia succinea TaxID=84632 RepID=A0ABT9PBN2_9ACTN|nr:GNAT family N-acetyltransferase [Kineosporia succinea]MDP9829921.1 diamine N-acetyltransferase [Kineosporia succinea]